MTPNNAIVAGLMEHDDYVDKLDQYVKALEGTTASSRQLLNFRDIPVDVFKTGYTHRLIYRGTEEEVVLRVQGYLIKHDLPPVLQRPRKAYFMKQSVRISGLCTEGFTNAVMAVEAIRQRLSRVLSPGSIGCWTPPIEGGAIAFDVSNRYFTPANDVGGETALDIPVSIDPHGYLRDNTGGGLYTDENVVEYTQRSTIANGEFKTMPVEPSAIRTGHLIEVQVSFALRTNPQGKATFSSVLRGITILDTSYQEVLEHAALVEFEKRIRPRASPSLKRARIETGHVEGATRDLKRLRLDENDEIMMTRV